MISICTVILSNMGEYLRVLMKTIENKTTQVNEMIIVQVDATENGIIKEWRQGNIAFRMLGYNMSQHVQGCPSPAWATMVCGHALGLHWGIEQSTNEYIWLTDPDVFFLDHLDVLYLGLICRYNLDIVGVSHFNPIAQAYQFFPCTINCLISTKKLPGIDWLRGQLWVRSGMRITEKPQPIVNVDGKYLIPGPIPEWCEQFPHVQGVFDVGCNLWLWNQQTGGRWLAFYLDQLPKSLENFGYAPLTYPLNYNTRYYKTNFGLEDDLGAKDLLYHRTRGTREGGKEYRQLYERIFPPQREVTGIYKRRRRTHGQKKL